MATPASIQKHPIHPMLIPFPIALWIFSLVCDVIHMMGLGGEAWKDMALYTMIGGLLGAFAAAIPGYIDYRSIADPAVKRVGFWHMVTNLSIVVLFAVNVLLRLFSEAGSIPVILSVIAVTLLGVSGWLGGELVYVHGIAVEPQESARAKEKDQHRVA
ncbi:MAG: DUF2231 domain-containing protein [Nitrospira sp.]|nr:DUF2231 domain-containing protein [Nitrospira sp.]